MKTDLAIKTASISELRSHQQAELRKLWIHGVHSDTNAVGWLPTSVFDSRARTNEITTVYRDGDLVGWLLRGESQARKVMKLYQIWVRPDARILEHGRALIDQVSAIALTASAPLLEAWVAEDLAANYFWSAIGFTRDVWRWGRGSSLRKIFRWCKLSAEKGGEITFAPEFKAVENYDTAKWRHTINCGTV